MMWKNRIAIDLRISDLGSGSSKKLRQDAMCVVNKNGLTESNTLTSKVFIIVNRIMIDIVTTIGPIELSVKQDNAVDKVATVTKER
jgi:hypothetical protein